MTPTPTGLERNSHPHHPQEKSPMSQPTPDTATPTEELLTRWFDAHRAEQRADAACKRARAALDEAMTDRFAAERELYERLAAGNGEPPRAWPYRSLVVWAEAGAVRFLRLAPGPRPPAESADRADLE
jgi:hypothetical protein